MTKEEALKKVKRYLTSYLNIDDTAEIEEIMSALEEKTTNDCDIPKEEIELSIGYLEGIQGDYVEGEGYERHPLPEWYAIDTAVRLMKKCR